MQLQTGDITASNLGLGVRRNGFGRFGIGA